MKSNPSKRRNPLIVLLNDLWLQYHIFHKFCYFHWNFRGYWYINPNVLYDNTDSGYIYLRKSQIYILMIFAMFLYPCHLLYNTTFYVPVVSFRIDHLNKIFFLHPDFQRDFLFLNIYLGSFITFKRKLSNANITFCGQYIFSHFIARANKQFQLEGLLHNTTIFHYKNIFIHD